MCLPMTLITALLVWSCLHLFFTQFPTIFSDAIQQLKFDSKGVKSQITNYKWVLKWPLLKLHFVTQHKHFIFYEKAQLSFMAVMVEKVNLRFS